MSVLNKMLKDIEQRETQAARLGLEQTVVVKPARDYALWLIRGLVLVVAVGIVAAGYYFIPGSTRTGLPAELKSEKSTQQPAAEPVFQQANMAESNLAPESNEPREPSVKLTQRNAPPVPVVAKTTPAQTNPEQEKAAPLQTVVARQPKQTQVSAGQAAAKAQAVRQPAVIFKPDLPPAPTEQAQQAFSAGKQALTYGLAEEAIAHLKRALTLNPSHIEARSLLVSAYYSQDRIKEAETVLHQGLALRPEVTRWRVTLAKLLTAQQRFGDVLLVLNDEYQDMAPLDYWILRGTAAQQQQQHALAVRCFHYLTQRQASQGKWWLALASSEQALGENARAEEHFDAALRLGGLSLNARQYAERRLRELRGL